jgi:CheY-like chemotaxis protein
MRAPAFPSRRILVVDDEPFVCEALRRMLHFDGHDVTTVSSGAEALALFEKGKFDLIITDFAMPSMDGGQLAAAIKERDPKQPIVMITAYVESLQSLCKPLKAVDLLLGKPFVLKDLRMAIAKVVPGASGESGSHSTGQ